LTVDVSVWSASRPGRFTPWKRQLGTHCVGNWLVPDALDLNPTGNRITIPRTLQWGIVLTPTEPPWIFPT